MKVIHNEQELKKYIKSMYHVDNDMCPLNISDLYDNAGNYNYPVLAVEMGNEQIRLFEKEDIKELHKMIGLIQDNE